MSGSTLPSMAVIIPASNEAGYIDPCLRALAASKGVRLKVVVVANGCRDDTATRARRHARALSAKGHALAVLELAAAGKPGALDAGDAVAGTGSRAYLDADVTVDPALMASLAAALTHAGPRYASGRPRLAPADSAITRAYGRFWASLPFFGAPAPGFGLFAVNSAGRARWGRFPAVISDDTFVRLQFAPSERVEVAAIYDWPMVEGFAALVRVRRRQDQGVAEIARRYPQLTANADHARPSLAWLARHMLRDPLAFGAYAAVSLAVRLGWGRQSGWVRGR